MRIGILTFHLSRNYGSVLQAYALKKELERISTINCDIINYQPSGQKAAFKIIRKCTSLRTFIADCYNIFYFLPLYKKEKKFQSFVLNLLAPTPSYVINEDSLPLECNKYDIIVVGSDQIWSYKKAVVDSNLSYFLNFSGNYKRIAYAPSFGVLETIENKDLIISLIKRFDFVSIREKNGNDFLIENGIKSYHVIDPTFFLSQDEWKKLIGNKPIIKGKYIFYYSIGCSSYSIKCTQKVAKVLNLPVVNPLTNPRECFSGFKSFRSMGPLEFLNLLYYADFVCTESFHGLAFSLIFNKKFAAIFSKDKKGNLIKEARKYSLLERLDALENIFTLDIDVRNFLSDIYENDHSEKIECFKTESTKLLEMALNK